LKDQRTEDELNEEEKEDIHLISDSKEQYYENDYSGR
jgi:hypothetical protein